MKHAWPFQCNLTNENNKQMVNNSHFFLTTKTILKPLSISLVKTLSYLICGPQSDSHFLGVEMFNFLWCDLHIVQNRRFYTTQSNIDLKRSFGSQAGRQVLFMCSSCVCNWWFRSLPCCFRRGQSMRPRYTHGMRWESGEGWNESLYECEQFCDVLRQLHCRLETTAVDLHWPNPGNHHTIRQSYRPFQQIPYQEIRGKSTKYVPSWYKGFGRWLYGKVGGEGVTELVNPRSVDIFSQITV